MVLKVKVPPAAKGYCPLIPIFFFLASCSPSSTVTTADVSDVLTKAANMAAQKLPAGLCINPALENNKETWTGKPGPDGWIPVPSGARYRRINSPPVDRLPDAALSAFHRNKKTEDCRNTLVFAKPEFIQVKTPTETHIEAIITFSDYCPLCGVGYACPIHEAIKILGGGRRHTGNVVQLE